MVDVHDKVTRSYNMSRIRSKNTKPEMLVRRFLHANGFRYKLHDRALPGKPDIVLPKYKTVILIHGCFWHGHQNCNIARIPKTNSQWWLDKINRNKIKDSRHLKDLELLKWQVITIWECDLKPVKFNQTLISAIAALKAKKY